MMKWLAPRRQGTHIDHFAETMRRKITYGLRPAPSAARGDAVGEEPYTQEHVRVSKRIIRRYSLLWMLGRAFR